MSMHKLIKLPDYVTILNAISGMISIYFSFEKKFFYAAVFLLCAMIFDFLDGKVARLLKSEGKLGFHLDSLADAISFGVAPALFCIFLYTNMLTLACGILLVVCGILRLARFNVTKLKGMYQGMPITFNGIIIPVVYFVHVNILYQRYFFIFPIILVISSFLMISSFTVKKII